MRNYSQKIGINIFFCVFFCVNAIAQNAMCPKDENLLDKQVDSIRSKDLEEDVKYNAEDSSVRSLFEELFHKKMLSHSLSLNMHFLGEAMEYPEVGAENYVFKMRTLRLQFQGKINDFLAYDYTQRLTQSLDGKGTIDQTGFGIDVLKLRFSLDKTKDISVGKLIAAYGGVSYNYNPIYVNQFDDIDNHITCFLPGVEFSYRPSSKHLFVGQILNAANLPFKDRYPKLSSYTVPKFPFGLYLYWEGTLLSRELYDWKTFYSINLVNQGRDKTHSLWKGNMYGVALGNEFQFLRHWKGYLDLLYFSQSIDDLGIISQITSPGTVATDVNYAVAQVRLEYHFDKQWALYAQGIYNYAGLQKNTAFFRRGLLREHIQTFGGVQFSSTKYTGVRLYLCLMRDHAHIPQLKQSAINNSLRLGLMYKIPIW